KFHAKENVVTFPGHAHVDLQRPLPPLERNRRPIESAPAHSGLPPDSPLRVTSSPAKRVSLPHRLRQACLPTRSQRKHDRPPSTSRGHLIKGRVGGIKAALTLTGEYAVGRFELEELQQFWVIRLVTRIVSKFNQSAGALTRETPFLRTLVTGATRIKSRPTVLSYHLFPRPTWGW
ncbi:hypothetical protein ACLKA7_005510, partial [Drosophila subpalustris]